MEARLHVATGVRLPLHPGTFKEAQREATHRAKFFFVYLHNHHHPDALPFVRDVLGDADVLDTLHTRCVCWAVDAATPEGFRFAMESNATTYPFVALCVKTRFVFSLQGYASPAQFKKELAAGMENAMPLMAQEVAFASERDSRELMRRQQEMELRAAEEEDARREAARRQQEAAATAERRAAEEAAAAARRAAEAKAQEEAAAAAAAEAAEAAAHEARALAMSALPEEAPADADPATVAQLRIMSIGGVATNWRLRRSEPVSVLRHIVAAQEDYDGSPLELTTGHPPRALPDDATPIGEIPALCPRAAVFARRL